MARTIDNIVNTINISKTNAAALNTVNSTSKVSIHGLFTYIIASAIWVFEQILNQHEIEVANIILEQKIGSLGWYRDKALNFQYGFDLITDTDVFDNKNALNETIEASKIITHAAVVETPDASNVLLKIASGTKDLSPIDSDQELAFKHYIDEVRFAGTRLLLVNQKHDQLYLNIDVYIDPLVLDLEGVNIRTGAKSVENAIQDYLLNALPFNGELTILALINVIEHVTGVVNLKILNVETASINNETGAYGNPVSIDVKHIPVSGYYKVVHFNNINYVV